MNTVAGSLIYVQVRRVTELFPPSLRKQFKSWELHAMVLLSLTLQIILIFFGNYRKSKKKVWIRIVLWCAYLMADWVATVALGVIMDNLGNVVDSNGQGGRLDANAELTAFWAPFLLLHLGGPDTITAYSLEDNELWLRHLLGLGVETGVALYIFILAWRVSQLSILSILMFCAGTIKYAERTWSLRSASIEEFRNSMITPADPGPNYATFMQEYSLKQYEGFVTTIEEIEEIRTFSAQNSSNQLPDALQLHKAHDLLQNFKRLFVDLILGVDERESSRSLFFELDVNKAFKLVEMELGFVYDMLYTKAALIHSRIGLVLRFISFSCTCTVLALFSMADHKHCSIVDLSITYLLMCAAVVLEVCAVLLLLSSDWTDLWFTKHLGDPKFISYLRLRKPRRWSNSIAQFDALSFYLEDKPMICGRILKLIFPNEMIQQLHYTKYEQVQPDLKGLIFNHLKSESEDISNVATAISSRGSQVLMKYGHTELKWSVEVDFDQSILIWHIATYLCYRADYPKTPEGTNYGKLSISLSQYMLHLLVMYPIMLPVGIGMIRFRDTQAEFNRFFEEYSSTSDSAKSASSGNIFSRVKYYLNFGRKSKVDKTKACEMLRKVNSTAVEPVKVKGDRSKSVLFEGCRLASQLQQGLQDDKEKKWEMISKVWVEMLAYAASRCRGNQHAQQLRRGGELLSHVWLLMAHFGLTEQFQISQGHARVKLYVK
ncbi:uncharacterized protein LOC107434620 [Ziziphus jujuba]|uniref:Uncharacterized protein LOC107434620 n=1 Tax=Ziziphus jujuba TaxID=326968 RepID=A0ABM3I7S6_ZIZJJ|nr:uncharacterized protein LOC107434620 [Ziziphus jujuba]